MSPPPQSRPPDATPFRLEVDTQKTQLRSVPHPDPNDQATAQAMQQTSAEYDALVEIAGTAEDGTLLSYSVATHDPETAARLQAFVASLKEEHKHSG